MAVTKKDITDLLERSIDAELAADMAGAGAEEHEFSAGFEERMREFFKNGSIEKSPGASAAPGSPKKGRLSKRGRRILIIAIAAVLALAATACAVPEIRKSIAGFFVQEFGDHVEYTDPDVTKATIEEEYVLTPVPEGFELIEEIVNEVWISRTYMDDDNNGIKLNQYAKGEIGETVDNEHGEIYEKEIAGKTVRIYFAQGGSYAAWVENGYYFTFVAAVEPIDKNTLEEWIASVQIVDSDPQ